MQAPCLTSQWHIHVADKSKTRRQLHLGEGCGRVYNDSFMSAFVFKKLALKFAFDVLGVSL